MTHLLDTNAFIAIMRGHEQACRQMQTFVPSDLGISTVIWFERCQNREGECIKVARLISPLHLIPIDAGTAEATRIRWILERHGNPMRPHDLQLAGQALAIDVTLMTHSTKEFQRASELRLSES